MTTHYETTPSIADTYDQQPTPTPMTRLEAIEYIVSRTDFDYPETPFRRRDPYTVTASEISQMTDDELRDYTKALQIVTIFEATVPHEHRADEQD